MLAGLRVFESLALCGLEVSPRFVYAKHPLVLSKTHTLNLQRDKLPVQDRAMSVRAIYSRPKLGVKRTQWSRLSSNWNLSWGFEVLSFEVLRQVCWFVVDLDCTTYRLYGCQFSFLHTHSIIQPPTTTGGPEIAFVLRGHRIIEVRSVSKFFY